MLSLTDTALSAAAFSLLPLGTLFHGGKPDNASLPAHPESNEPVPEPALPALCFGPSEDSPVLAISPYPGFKKAGRRPLDMVRSKIDLLTPALQAAPALLAAAELASGQYMRVVVNGTLAKCKDGIGVRAFVRDASGHIREQARLFEPTALSRLVNAAALWQIATVMTAQMHMQKIQKSLEAIRRDVADIKEFLEAQRRSVLTGAMVYLGQARVAILEGEFPDAVRNELERIERDLLNIQQHLLEEINALSAATLDIEHNEWFGSEQFFKAISAHQDKFDKLRQQWLLCMRVRAANWQVLAAFPEQDALRNRRLNSILASLQSMTRYGPVGCATAERMTRKIGELDSRLNRARTLAQRRSTLMDRSALLQAACDNEVYDTVNALKAAGETLERGLTSLSLAVEMDRDRVVAAYQLECA